MYRQQPNKKYVLNSQRVYAAVKYWCHQIKPILINIFLNQHYIQFIRVHWLDIDISADTIDWMTFQALFYLFFCSRHFPPFFYREAHTTLYFESWMREIIQQLYCSVIFFLHSFYCRARAVVALMFSKKKENKNTFS